MRTEPGRLVLLGHPLGHSLSPRMQNAALRAAGIGLTYEPVDIPRSAVLETVERLRRERAAGNVTTPYKEAVAELCDRLTGNARHTGAVNTFWTAIDGALVGDNTDVDGFDAAVRSLLGSVPAAARVAVLGAGGATAAVLHAMKGWQPSNVRVYSRTMSRARDLLQRLSMVGSVEGRAEDAVRDASIVVNATPVGMNDDETPVSPETLPSGCAVIDLVYRSGETALVRRARARGLRAADGLTMLVEQGALAFERWFGVAANREAMWSAMPERR